MPLPSSRLVPPPQNEEKGHQGGLQAFFQHTHDVTVASELLEPFDFGTWPALAKFEARSRDVADGRQTGGHLDMSSDSWWAGGGYCCGWFVVGDGRS